VDILEDLTEPQREAVTHVEGPLLVLAGAGSGKTRVITRRVAHLIEHGIDPTHILAITFTNKAAEEMTGRVECLVGRRRPWMGTFHAFCARQLRRHGTAVGVQPTFSIYDTDDAASLIKQVMSEANVDPVHFPPRRMAARISRAKQDLVTPEAFATRAGDYQSRIAAAIYGPYQAALRARNALDFDDLLAEMCRLLTEHDDARDALSRRFRFILVDEYQDTNRAQYVIARELARAHGNLCVTGDPDQSIYGWRGATIDNILNFERDFPNATVVRLEENWRSTKTILWAASELIRHNRRRQHKDLWTGNPDGERIRQVRLTDERAEADFVRAEIEALTDEDYTRSDVAVFYRVNALSRPIEERLTRAGIPYQLVGAVAFYQRKEVRDVLAFLKVLANPHDDVSLLRIINTPPRGIGATTIKRLRAFARERGVALFEAVQQHETVPDLRAPAHAAIERFLAVIGEFAFETVIAVADLIRAMVERSGYAEALRTSEDEADRDRLRNVDQLIAAAAEYDAQTESPSLIGFLERVALMSDQDAYAEGAERITLMTLHAAKGLEFPVVFIIGMEDGILPHHRREDLEDLEEERRLFFVGMTRTKHLLVLTHCHRRAMQGRPMVAVSSPFLDELPLGTRRVEDRALHVERAFAKDARIRPTTDESGLPQWEFRPGMLVRSPAFGVGSVVSQRGIGDDARVIVRFNTLGEKVLVVRHARLERIG